MRRSGNKDKGEFGYISGQKRRRTLITAGMFAITVLIFVTGLILRDSRLNMFTFIAIMGCLPGARSATGMIMMLMQKPCSPELRDKAEMTRGSAHVLYDMVFTAYQKNIPTDCVAVNDTQIIAYSSSPKADPSFGEGHLKEILKENGCKSVGVKIYTAERPFLDQMKLMGQREEEGEKAEYLCEVLKAVVL